MSIDFLTPEMANGRGVRARSPMERAALAAGAHLAHTRHLSVAAAFAEPARELARLTETVAFADRSHMVKLELQGEPRALAELVATASGQAAPEPRTASFSAGAWWCPVTPARTLVLAEPSPDRRIHAAIEHPDVGVVDMSCALAGLSLHGPLARELLARFCAIDVRPALAPAGAFRPGSIARTPGYLLVEAPDSLLLLVGWALGEYLWEVVADAAEHLGGGPVGAEALARHRGSAHA